jgi:hypothetical protein
LSERWCNFDYYESASTLGPHGELPPWNLFVQQQLGLIEIRPLPSSKREPGGWGGRGWLVRAARLTAWGTAVTWALLDFWKRQLEEKNEAEAEDNDEQERTEKPDELRENGSAETPFGMLQPAFQPYFPEWRTVYTLPRKDGKRRQRYRVEQAWTVGRSSVLLNRSSASLASFAPLVGEEFSNLAIGH